MERSNQNYFPYIPQEIIMEILLLLPFESVITRKLVSIEWNNLIKNPKFVSRYRNGGPLALFVYNGKIYSVLAKKTAPQFSVSPVELKSLQKIRESTTIPIAANGTCCFETKNRSFIFYNLFNGSRHEVVSDTTFHKYIYRGPKMTSLICCGYGYDCYEDDHKLLMVWINTRNGYETVKIKENGQFCVYSTRNRGWKQLDGFPHDEYGWWEGNWPNRAYSMKGVLHWVVVNDKNRNKLVNIRCKVPHVIVTYNMHSGRFGEISLPDGWIHIERPNLTELGGRLCCRNFRWNVEDRYQVWTMKEYGVRESWTKLLSVEHSGLRRLIFNPRNVIEPTRLCETQDGRKLVLFVGCRYGTLHWYDIDNDKVKTVCKEAWLKK